MTIVRALINILDRPGGRVILGGLASRYARRITGQDIAVEYDGCWLHRVGTRYVADGERFDYYRPAFMNFKSSLQHSLQSVRDGWFQTYTPQPGDFVIDAGAGCGLESVVLSELVGETGRVLAVEANPASFRRFAIQCAKNRLTNIIACHRAVVDRTCTVYIENRSDPLKNTVGAGSESPSAQSAVAGSSVDELCREFGFDRIDYLKMNIEGAEKMAIQGMREMIGKTRHVCIQCHDFLVKEGGDPATYATLDTVTKFLREHDFKVVVTDWYNVCGDK